MSTLFLGDITGWFKSKWVLSSFEWTFLLIYPVLSWMSPTILPYLRLGLGRLPLSHRLHSPYIILKLPRLTFMKATIIPHSTLSPLNRLCAQKRYLLPRNWGQQEDSVGECLLYNPNDLIPGTYTKVEGENYLCKIVFWPLHISGGIQTHRDVIHTW